MQGKFYIPLVFILLSKKLLLLVEAATITCLYRTYVDYLFLQKSINAYKG